jgi:hypothetical protein
MSILWVGAEDIDFATRTGGLMFLSEGDRRPEYSRAAIRANGTSVWLSPTFGPVTDVWATGRHSHGAGTTAHIASLRNSSNGAGVGVCKVSGTWALRKYANATDVVGTNLAVSVTPIAATGVEKWDLHITSFGASGTITLYLEGSSTPTCTYTGDLTTGGITNLDYLSIASGSLVATDYHSELIVATSDTRLMSLVTLAPTSAGDANTFASGAYTEIDETTLDTADYLLGDTNGQAGQFGLSAAPTGTFTVTSVIAKVLATKGETGPSQLKVGVKTNGVVDLATAQALDLGLATYQRAMELNSQTGARFTIAELDALQLALEVIT